MTHITRTTVVSVCILSCFSCVTSRVELSIGVADHTKHWWASTLRSRVTAEDGSHQWHTHVGEVPFDPLSPRSVTGGEGLPRTNVRGLGEGGACGGIYPSLKGRGETWTRRRSVLSS